MDSARERARDNRTSTYALTPHIDSIGHNAAYADEASDPSARLHEANKEPSSTRLHDHELPTIRCDASGVAQLDVAAEQWLLAYHGGPRAVDVLLEAASGRVETLHALGRSPRGLTSRRYANARLFLKAVTDGHMARREACVLRRLAAGDLVPRLVPKLLCSSEHIVITEYAGDPLSDANLPANYRGQASALLEQLSAHGVRHNDLWKSDMTLPSLFITELVVDAAGRSAPSLPPPRSDTYRPHVLDSSSHLPRALSQPLCLCTG